MAKNISVALMTFAMFFMTLKAEKEWTIGISVTGEEMMSNFKVNTLNPGYDNYYDQVNGIYYSFLDINNKYLNKLKEEKKDQIIFNKKHCWWSS